MATDITRREFLAKSSALTVGTAVSTVLLCRTARAQTRTNLPDLSAVAAVAAMQKGEIKAEDYARALLDQAQSLEHLNAFRTLDHEKVLEAARAADKARASGAALGALHGLPIPVKDSVNTKSLPTSNGTRALRDFQPQADAAVLKPLFAQGAILMGKTNLHELSCGWTSNNGVFGPVRNPYDNSRVPGGSSGGSGAAVAARIAPLAVAEDTLGSIRVPASMCGLAGLRPSFGRYPDDGIMPLTTNKFDQVGPLARSVADLALFDMVVTGQRAPLAPVPLKGVRIGISPESLSGLDPEVERITLAGVKKLEAAGITLVRAEVPEPVKGAIWQLPSPSVPTRRCQASQPFLKSTGRVSVSTNSCNRRARASKACSRSPFCRPTVRRGTSTRSCWRGRHSYRRQLPGTLPHRRLSPSPFLRS